jgi:CubicO group peptidase (beta-lactamase class C family)
MTKKIKKIGRVFLLVASFIIGLLLLVLVFFSVKYSPEYVLRALKWGDSDVYDYQKFPERVMKVGPKEFTFDQKLNEAAISSFFELHPKIDGLESFIEKSDTQALIVIQDDAVLYEQYANGAERDSILTSFSIAKSFTSALIGIAIEEGFINSVDDPISVYLPELAERDPGFAQITIKDLLKMSSGIDYREFFFLNGDNTLTYYHPNLRQLALSETEIVDQPGNHFLYNNYHPLLLGIILERATGQPVAAYLEQKIWQPIGMEFPGSWSLDENGFEKMESGINARAIDFAKFGRLYLNMGRWGEDQVIPEQWIAESIQSNYDSKDEAYYQSSFGPKIFATASGGYYQYMWYGLTRENGADDFYAAGNKGQLIYISPQANLIIIRNGESYGPNLDHFEWIEIFYDFSTHLIEEHVNVN